MSELVTLSKKSPDFESYLLGTFSNDKRALPIQTLNVNSSAETVTFKIVSKKEIQRPSLFSLLLQILKVRSFLFVLTPMFLVMTKNLADHRVLDPDSSVLASLGVLFAFVAMSLRNDFMDHMRGVDRVLEDSGSRAIQNGWVTALTVKRLSTVFLILAILCSVPLVVVYPSLAIPVVMAAGLGLWGQFMKMNSFRYQRFGEFVLFAMLGPLLTVGYQIAMGAGYDQEGVWLGCVWGWLVLFVVHLRNFRNILPSSQAGFVNTVNWLGFDRSRRMLAAWWVAFMALNVIYHFEFAGFFWGFYLAAGLALLSIQFVSKLKCLSSPVGSDMREVYRSGYLLFLLTIGLWVVECLWYLWT